MNKKIKAIGFLTMGSIIVGGTITVSLPFLLKKQEISASWVKKKIEEIGHLNNTYDIDALASQLTGPESDDAKNAVKAFVRYIHQVNLDQNDIFNNYISQKEEKEYGITKAAILVNDNKHSSLAKQKGPQPDAFELDDEDESWVTNLVQINKVSFGIYLEFINKKIYTIKIIDPNELSGDSKLLDLNEGHSQILRFLTDLKVDDYKKDVIGNDGSIRPTKFNLSKLFLSSSFIGENKLRDNLAKQIEKFKKDGKIITMLDGIAHFPSSTTANIQTTFLNRKRELEFIGFKPNSSDTPVNQAFAILNEEKNTVNKKAIKPPEDNKQNIEWIFDQLGENSTDIDNVDYDIIHQEWDGFLFKAKIKITNTNDLNDTKTANLTINGFMSKEDLKAKELFNVSAESLINGYLKKLVTNQNPQIDNITASVGTDIIFNEGNGLIVDLFHWFNPRKNLTFDLKLKNDITYRIRLDLIGKPNDVLGKIIYKYTIKAGGTDNNLKNTFLSRDITGVQSMRGFKTSQKNAVLQAQALKYLNSLTNGITVKNRHAIIPLQAQNPQVTIRNAYEDLLAKPSKIKKPIGEYQIKILSRSNATGSIMANIAYHYGNIIASKNIPIYGYKNTSDVMQEKIDSIIATLNKHQIISAKDNAINTFKKDDVPTVDNINALLAKKDVITLNNELTTKIKVISDEHATDLKLAFTISSTLGGTPKTTIITINKLLSQADFDAIKLNDAVIAKLKDIMEAKGDQGGTATDNKDKMPSTPVDIKVGQTTFSVTFKQAGVDKAAINDEDGTMKFLYSATAIGLNKSITNVPKILDSFNTNNYFKNKAQAYLDSLNIITVKDQESLLPSDAQKDKNALDAIKNAYNDLLQKATDQNKPKGSPTFTIKSVDNDSGKLVVTIKYEYGEQIASANIDFKGFKTTSQYNEEKLKADVDQLKDKVHKSVKTSKPDNNVTNPDDWTISNLNAVLDKNNQIPAAINGVKRKYVIIWNGNKELLTVKINFSLNNHSATHEFEITGFEWKKHLKNKAQAYLDSLTTITVQDQDSSLPSNVKNNGNTLTAIKKTYNELVKKAPENKKPFGTPATISIKSAKNDGGILVVTIKYEYGGHTASADINFNGWKTTSQDNKEKLKADVERVKDKVHKSVKTSKPDEGVAKTTNWTISNLNAVLDKNNQIPAAIHSVKRTYGVTWDKNTGSLTVKINFSLNNQSATHEFKITGFNSNDLLREKAQSVLNSGTREIKVTDPSYKRDVFSVYSLMPHYVAKKIFMQSSYAKKIKGTPGVRVKSWNDNTGKVIIYVRYEYGSKVADQEFTIYGFDTNGDALRRIQLHFDNTLARASKIFTSNDRIDDRYGYRWPMWKLMENSNSGSRYFEGMMRMWFYNHKKSFVNIPSSWHIQATFISADTSKGTVTGMLKFSYKDSGGKYHIASKTYTWTYVY